jgi:hypothetical protein
MHGVWSQDLYLYSVVFIPAGCTACSLCTVFYNLMAKPIHCHQAFLRPRSSPITPGPYYFLSLMLMTPIRIRIVGHCITIGLNRLFRRLFRRLFGACHDLLKTAFFLVAFLPIFLIVARCIRFLTLLRILIIALLELWWNGFEFPL